MNDNDARKFTPDEVIAALRVQNEDLRSELAKRDAEVADLRAEIERERSESAAYEAELQLEIDARDAEVERLKNQVAESTERSERLCADVLAVTDERDEARAEVERLRVELEGTRGDVLYLGAVVDSYAPELAEARAQLADLPRLRAVDEAAHTLARVLDELDLAHESQLLDVLSVWRDAVARLRAALNPPAEVKPLPPAPVMSDGCDIGPEMLALAHDAVKRMDAAPKESAEQWAERMTPAFVGAEVKPATMSTVWRIDYSSDTGPGDDDFREWWEITDGARVYKCENEKHAAWLCGALNGHGIAEVKPEAPCGECGGTKMLAVGGLAMTTSWCPKCTRIPDEVKPADSSGGET